MYFSCGEDEMRACLEPYLGLSSGSGLLTPFAANDKNLVTTRWYLDAEVFAERFADTLQPRVKG